MSWTVKDFKDAIEKNNIPDDAVIHLQINKRVIDQIDTVIFMERTDLYPALVLSPFIRTANDYITKDNKIIDKKSLT